MINLTEYLSKKQRKNIIEYYNNYVELDGKARTSAIGARVETPASIVKQYLIKKLGQDTYNKTILHAESDYISTTGIYIRFTDYYQLYLHQFILAQELELLNVEDIKKYVVHHINSSAKQNNNITNLCLFFNDSIHRIWHSIQDKYNGTIYDYIYSWIEAELQGIEEQRQDKQQEIELDKYERELREYIMLVNKLMQEQKKYA